MNVLNLLLGMGIGATLGLTGAGGGILAIPALVLGAGLTMAEAKPVALLAVAMGAALGAVDGLRHSLLRYKAAGYMSIFGIAFSPVGIALSAALPARFLAVLFSGILLVVAWRSWHAAAHEKTIENNLQAVCQTHSQTGKFIWSAACFAALGGIGTLAGLMSGMLGVGGGFLLVPLLQRFTTLRYQSVVVTSLAVIALVSAFSAGHMVLLQGAQIGQAGGVFIAATAVGMVAGRRLVRHLSQRWLQRGFAALVLLSTALLLLKTFAPALLAA